MEISNHVRLLYLFIYGAYVFIIYTYARLALKFLIFGKIRFERGSGRRGHFRRQAFFIVRTYWDVRFQVPPHPPPPLPLWLITASKWCNIGADNVFAANKIGNNADAFSKDALTPATLSIPATVVAISTTPTLFFALI